MSPHTPAGETRERVYRFVRKQLEKGLPPTVRDVQSALGFRAVQTAREHLEKLVTEGRLAKHAGKARGYYLPNQPPPPSLIPLLGQVQAGALNLAVENLEGYLPVSPAQGDNLFALRIQGDSMKDAGILPGDMVVVRSQPTAASGDIVVALVDDEATVKTLYLGKQHVELRPANPAFDLMRFDPSDVAILGKVVEVRRILEGT